MRSVKGSFKWVTLSVSILSMLSLVACSTGGLVKTYDGDVLDKSKVGILTAAENISLLSVNGRAVQKYLLSNIEVNYALQEGGNVVVFEYESIWGKAKRGSEGSSSEKVLSEPKEVLINVKAGDKYLFNFIRPENSREAKKLAAEFKASIHNQNGVLVAESGAVARRKPNVGSSESRYGQPNNTDGLGTLESLKGIWATMSSEDKKEFLIWAFQE